MKRGSRNALRAHHVPGCVLIPSSKVAYFVVAAALLSSLPPQNVIGIVSLFT